MASNKKKEKKKDNARYEDTKIFSQIMIQNNTRLFTAFISIIVSLE